jgi:hypothetical protein
VVDDPSAVPEEFPTEEAQENERLRLFALISELVLWESATNPKPGSVAGPPRVAAQKPIGSARSFITSAPASIRAAKAR